MKKLILLSALSILGANVQAQFSPYSDPVKLGGTVNTEAEESMPLFSKDSSILYFSRTYDPTNTGGPSDLDIWSSKRLNSGEYGECELVKNLNNKMNNSVFGLSKDGNTIYLLDSYEGKKDLIKGCAVSIQNANGWGTPEHVNIPTLDIEGDFYGFHVSEDETVILISYKGPGTIGEEDLYVSLKNDNNWSIPLHLGNVVNTSGFEITPFLSTGHDTLYFSSNGHGGLGDGDIFYSIRQGSSWTDWSTPTNLGDKINSPKFDAYFTRSTKQVFWSSNRESEKSDIYYANIITPPALTCDLSKSDVTVNKGTDGKVDLIITGGVGPFSYLWSNGSTEEDIAGLSKGNYAVIVTDILGQSCEVRVDITEPEPPLIAAVVESQKNVENAVIYFDLNSSYLNKENIKSLKEFAKLNAKGTSKIIITSHCDARDTEEYNIWLSKRRLESTTKYLVAHGIAKSRISGEYKGEKEPDIKCTDCTEEQFTKNRRTTIAIIL